MKRYFEHMAGKSTHERRQHATRVAGAVTGVVALLWVVSLGYRLPMGGGTENPIAGSDSSAQSQLASVVAGLRPATSATLEVSTTSVLQDESR